MHHLYQENTMNNTDSQRNQMPTPALTQEVIMTNKPTEKALVVLSGGADSTISLHWSLAKFGEGNVKALSFSYGQRHSNELVSAATISKMAGIPHTILPINTFTDLGGSALVGSDGDVNGHATINPALPASYVPARNLIFLTFAAAYAYQRGIHHLVTGVAEADYAGYPDCREATIEALERALSLGMDYEIHIHTPLMHLSKADSVHLALQLGSAAMEALAFSHTCYQGSVPPCGTCSSCILRARGFQEAGIEDPLITRTMRSQQ
jgi:7-cyano-7-deazaguanine synthase